MSSGISGTGASQPGFWNHWRVGLRNFLATDEELAAERGEEDADLRNHPVTLSGFCSTLRGRMCESPTMIAHVAIVIALVVTVFHVAVNSNFFFLLVVGAGACGEGYLVYQIYKQGRDQERAQEARRQEEVQSD